LPEAIHECDEALELDPENKEVRGLRARIARALEILRGPRR
jgi:hypothetical protein